MNRRGFVMGASGLLVPRAAEAGYVGTRRALYSGNAPGIFVADFTTSPASATVSPVTTNAWPKGAPPNGDYLLAVVTGGASGSPSVSPPSGWNTLYSGTGGTGSSDFSTAYLGWKWANGEGTTETWQCSAGTNRLCLSLLRVRGALNAPPQFTHAYSTSSPGGTTPLAASSRGGLVVACFTATSGVTALSIQTAGYVTDGYVHLNTNDDAAIIGHFSQLSYPGQSYAASCASTGTLFAMQVYQVVIPAAA